MRGVRKPAPCASLNHPPPRGGAWITHGKEAQDRLILALVVCQVIFRVISLLCALLVQEKLPNHQPQTQTHAHLRLSYGAPVCRVKADSCGPLVRAVGVAPKCRPKTCELHGRGSKDFINQLGLIDTYTRDPAKDRPTGNSDDRPDNG